MHRDGPKAHSSDDDEEKEGDRESRVTQAIGIAQIEGENSREGWFEERRANLWRWWRFEKTENSISACHHSTRILSLL